MVPEIESPARILMSKPGVKIEMSLVVFAQTTAGAGASPEIQILIVGEKPAVLDLDAYPTLKAIWDNEDDAIFDTL